MARALDAAKADAQDLSKKSVNYNVMEREANSNRQVYESLLQRANELRVSSNSRAEQRARDRSRRGAEGADGAHRPPDLAAVARRRPRAGGRRWPTASTT